MGRAFGRWLLWLVLAGLALQFYFLAGIALMAVLDPHSTAFQRSAPADCVSAGLKR